MSSAQHTAIGRALPRRFYNRPVVTVARELLGLLLVRDSEEGRVVGRIVETEAYLAVGDPASHSYRGPSKKNASMFGPPGHAYVYVIHARHCVNVVTEPVGVASAVLIRAVEPIEGLPLMHLRRGVADPRLLARGPARLCQAFAVDRQLDGWDLTQAGPLFVARASRSRGVGSPLRIVATPRIGVTSGAAAPLRFCVAGSVHLSRPCREPPESPEPLPPGQRR